jgi:hypothetical protein
LKTPLPKIRGFDRQGEPELRAGDNGALELVFNFMPPMTASGEERAPALFEVFEAILSNHLGVTVARDDREMFIISSPLPDTAEKLAAFLSSFWKQHAKPLKAALAAVPRDPNAPFRNTSDVYACLREKLEPRLKPLGFKFAKFMDVSFRRKTRFGFETLCVNALAETSHYRPRAHVFTFHDRVERIYAMASDMEKRFFKWQWTTSGPLGELPVGRFARPSDVDVWVPQFLAHLEAVALPMLEKRSDLDLLEREFNDMSSVPAAYMSGPRPDSWAGHGLIIAKLLGRENLEEIAAFHRVQLGTLESVNCFPQVEAIVMGSSVEDLIAKAKAW